MASVSLTESSLVGTAASSALQGDGLTDTPLAWRGLRLETIVTMRWLGLLGQTLALAAVAAIGFRAPYLQCALVVAAGAAVNLGVSLVGQRVRLASNAEATIQLGFDLVQLLALLFFTGGVVNPFALLLIG